MNIKLTDTYSFVITGRNKNNSSFYIRPKSDFETERKNGTYVISTVEGFKTEDFIINQINLGTEFYTFSDCDFTIVKIVDNQLKSYKNETTIDNIGELPVIV